MDFKELYEKAQKNARKEEKKVKEVNREIESRKRKQDELMAIERAREKFDLKRRILNHKIEIKNSIEQKKDFVIPKKSSHNQQQENHSFRKISGFEKKVEKKLDINRSDIQNIKKVNSLNQLKQTKGESIQNTTKSIMPQSQNFNNLLKQAEKNDAIAVEQLFNDVESSSFKKNKISHNVKKVLPPSDGLGISAGLNLSVAREKQKELKQKNKYETTKIAEKSTLDSQKYSKTNKIAQSKMPPSYNNQKINSQFATTKSNFQQSTTPKLTKNKIETEKQELTKTNGFINKSIDKSKNNKIRISLPSKTIINKTSNNLSINAHPDTSLIQNPQKRYLPGDIRYQGPIQKNKNNSLQQKQIISSDKKNISSIPSLEKIQKIEKLKSSIPSSNISLNNKSNITPFVQKQQSNTNKNLLIEKKIQNKVNLSLPLDRRKELPLNKNNNNIKMVKNTIVENKLKRPLKSDGISLAHIKQESVNRHQMLKNIRKGNSVPTSSNNKKMKYANYSETDDDEDDDETGRYDDEYDSDLSDFIDDSMVDDLQREDLEETLRLINPRYDKQKWLIRERMIDDRRMDARFKEVEMEERRSAKYGLVEDLIEAKRGSKALA